MWFHDKFAFTTFTITTNIDIYFTENMEKEFVYTLENDMLINQ